MGCFGSRLDKRNDNCTDLNTVGMQFIGGADQQIDWCPLDKIIVAYFDKMKDEGAKLEDFAGFFKVEGMTMDEEHAHKLGKEIYGHCDDMLKGIKSSYGDDLTKDTVIYDKYTVKEVGESLNGVMTLLRDTAAIKDLPELEKPAGEAPAEGEGEAKPDGEEAEGGDAADAPAEGEAKEPATLPGFDPYADLDLSGLSGAAKLPELLVGATAKYPFFGDVCKAQMLKWEFNHDTNPPQTFSFAPVTGIMNAAVEKGGGSATEVWFSGMVGDHDFEALQEMATAKADILFPGVMRGWDSKENAMKYVSMLADKSKTGGRMVIYHANTACVNNACNLLVHRYSGKIDSHKTEDKIECFELAEQETPLKSLISANYSEWKDGVAAKLAEVAAAAAAAANPPAEEPKPDGEAKPDGEGEAKPEGEEAPAE